ncbi:S-adenosyl-L-methionine-dependent methyltransferase [Ceraceosorus guamensis]|uniref:S-adenosyl-L-methionine-dependent methyltransferase n=1 Tax=Ceraceosorus guamensis TaxID=1522189 RepID=A0A316W305_9BASI|nr:S-adenosyl-L-methionine-dependent methyltransferase [Ceraceosorus guamensis]PWN43478.1 S-adenosyl-L-methionine-dependent methyltransferase [Ceraceosorus guamensis]
MSSDAALQKARQLVDEAHSGDPESKELSYADGVESWATKLLSDYPSSTSHFSTLRSGHARKVVLLAARCQHLERFKTPRSSYPEGKAGYFKWRRGLYDTQANRAKELLLSAAVSEEDAENVAMWVRKEDLKPGKEGGEAGTQLLEDAAVLVFLEEQLAAFAQAHPDYTREKVIDILKKTWRKLSPVGKEAVSGLTFPDALAGIIAEATAAVAPANADSAIQEGQTGPSAPQSAEDLNVSALDSLGLNGGHQEMTIASSSGAFGSETLLHAAAERVSSESIDRGGRTFGNRILSTDDDMWKHNAWDHAKPPPEHLQMVEGLLSKQRESKVTAEEAERYHSNAASYWDEFYASHENRFFRDRHWLHHEFPELTATTFADYGPARVLEVGCGAGNTVFPLLEMNRNPHLSLVACDYSAEAVRVVQSHELYRRPSCGTLDASVWDLSSTEAGAGGANLPRGVEAASVDIAVLIFVLSALHPKEWRAAVRNIATLLKPGGIVLLRDYARHDLPQLRFRKGRYLEENFYGERARKRPMESS